MKAIVQQEETGCGIACIATLVQQPYIVIKAVANSLGIFATDRRLYSDTSYIRQLLAHYRLKTSDKELAFDNWQTLPDLALLASKYHIKSGIAYWHGSVFYRSQNKAVVLDPDANLAHNCRTDFENIWVHWYIAVFEDV